MKPATISLSALLAQRIGTELTARIVGVGASTLLVDPLLGLIASRECPGQVLLETLERVPEWVKAGRVIVSGFHSPLEQQVLRSALRRQGRLVKVLARGMTKYTPPPEESEAMAAGRLLVITASPADVRRTTRESALQRNQFVIALSTEMVTPYVAEGSALIALLGAKKQ